MKLLSTAIEDVKLIEPRVFRDERGLFLESWNARAFAEVGIDASFVQDNHSRSVKHVLRGLHYQLPNAQGKLVRVARGRAFDVAVDMRRSSPSYGHWVGVELSDDNQRMLWIPPGFAHGFLSLEDGTDVLYKCTEFYAPQHERSLLWNDPALGIDWPLDGGIPQLSAKDAAGVRFADTEAYP